MPSSLLRVACAILLPLAMAAACGSDDGKRRVTADDGGEAGRASEPSDGGSISHAGTGSEGGAGGAPLATAGQGGAPAPIVTAGAAGQSEGGTAGAPAGVCCEAKTCGADLGIVECGYLDDGCGNEVFCDCQPGFECNEGSCDACVVDPQFCENNTYACGETFDNCGNPISCPDMCSSQTSGGICANGECCGSKWQCSFGDCGLIDNNCGGVLDCSGFACETGTCINNSCCEPNNDAPCADIICGYGWDGCQEVFCADPCESSEVCLNNVCETSSCKAKGYTCGQTPNPAVSEGEEQCGSCPNDEGCVDHQCLPTCD